MLRFTRLGGGIKVKLTGQQSNMDSGKTIPIIGDASSVEQRTVSRWRWWLHLTILALFPLLAGVSGILNRDQAVTLLPDSVAGLLRVSVFELIFFGVIFGIAWLASRVNFTQLRLSWRGGGKPLWLGFAYSFALRVAITLVLSAVVIGWMLVTGLHSPGLDHVRPQTEQVVSAAALTQNPLYFALTLTLISFVVAGFREELWRAGMLAGLGALFPGQFATWRGRAVAVVIVAVLFGLGHTAQGWAGVGVTGLLGVGLGIIMLWHRSIWEAVIAHGFFNAGTFAVLYCLAKYQPQQFQNL